MQHDTRTPQNAATIAASSEALERTVRLVAALAGSDTRTVRKYLTGGPVKGLGLRDRLAAAAKQAAGILGPAGVSPPTADAA